MSQFKEDWHEYVLLSCAIHGQVNYLVVHDECNCICAFTCFFYFCSYMYIADFVEHVYLITDFSYL